MAAHSRKDLVSKNGLESLYDRECADALINLLPLRLVPIFERVKKKMPKTLMSDERTIREFCKPDTRDERVRLSFWDEYNASTSIGKRMSLQSILCGAVHWDTWVGVYEPNDTKMCWIFTPPTSYVASMRHILHAGTERLLEIMQLPMLKDDGKVDTRVATLILRAWQLADMRMKGGVMQRVQIEQKSMNVNIDASNSSKVDEMSLEELEAVERRIERAKRDQIRYLKGATEENRDAVIELARNGDFEMLEDIENMTTRFKQKRNVLPPLPSLANFPEPEDELEGEDIT